MTIAADCIPNDFWIGWDLPIRAYPGVALQHRLTYYEVDNRQITWSLSNAPSGMTIDGTGTITWSSPSAGTYASIVVTATRAGRNTTDFPSASLTATQTFTCVCATTQYVFVATTGNDTTGTGLIGAPYLTIAKAVTTITGAGGGKAIMVRGGNYTEAWTTGMWASQTFTAAAYAEIVNYYGENVDINCAANAGLWFADTCTYAVMRGGNNGTLTVHGATLAESANVKIHGTHQVAKDIVSHSASFTGDNNCTGVLVAGDDCIANRIVAYSNKNATGNQTNVSNFLFYNDTTNGTKWVLNCKAYDSNIGFKIKHTNNSGSRTILHNFETHTCQYGVMGAGINSSYRYGVIWKQDYYGISINKTDPSAYTVGQMLIENITVVGKAASNTNYWVESSYGTTGPITIRRCISHQSNGAPSGGRGDVDNARKHVACWIDTAPLATAQGYPFYADRNIYYNSTSNTAAFQCGNNGAPVVYDLAGWQALTGASITRDPNSVASNPNFNNVASGLIYATSSDPIATSAEAGTYIGAFRPDQTYTAVGNSNTTLLNFDHSSNSVAAASGGGGAVPVSLNVWIFKRHRR